MTGMTNAVVDKVTLVMIDILNFVTRFDTTEATNRTDIARLLVSSSTEYYGCQDTQDTKQASPKRYLFLSVVSQK